VSFMIGVFIATANAFVPSIILSMVFFIAGIHDPHTQFIDYWLAKNYPGLFPSLYRRYRKKILKEEFENIKAFCGQFEIDSEPFLERFYNIRSTGDIRAIWHDIFEKLFEPIKKKTAAMNTQTNTVSQGEE